MRLPSTLLAWRGSLAARSPREKAVLLAALLTAGVYFWLVLLYFPLRDERLAARQQIQDHAVQIEVLHSRRQELEQSQAGDPNAFARQRVAELQAETLAVDERLGHLYGQLIPSREMSNILTSILEQETGLRLVSLENLPPRSMFNVEALAPPLVGDALLPGAERGLEMFKHGLRLVFEGDFLDTVRYLRSLEALEGNVFWEELRFEVLEHPRARITLQIFTLSTEKEWIGV